MRTDAKIQQDVENEIRWSPGIDATDIAVTVKNGTVELAGFVKNYGDKFEAETAAKRVMGVVGLANDIEVRLPNLDQRPDPDIARDAVAAIRFQLPYSSANMKVCVENGWVTLEGTADWHYHKQTAETAIRNLKGVKGVSDLIKLEPQVAPSEVKRQIEAAFKRNAAIDASRIKVEVRGGDVTLRGSVRSWMERQEVETAAWAAPGVTKVNDQMRIASGHAAAPAPPTSQQ
jgi:osmotically-inducible protein OsmY